MNPDEVTLLPMPKRTNVPKQTFGDQCAWHALHHIKGVHIDILAQAAGINKTNMSQLCARTPKAHYNRVRREADSMGLDRLFRTYVTQSHLDRLTEVMTKKPAPRVQTSGTAMRKDPTTGEPIEFEVFYSNEGFYDRGAGWYYKDPRFLEAGGLVNNRTNLPSETKQDLIRWLQTGEAD